MNAIVVGVSDPAVMIIFGQTVDEFANSGKFAYCDSDGVNYNKQVCALTLENMTEKEEAVMAPMIDNQSYSASPIMEGMTDNVYWFIGMGVVSWICGWIQTTTLMVSASR